MPKHSPDDQLTSTLLDAPKTTSTLGSFWGWNRRHSTQILYGTLITVFGALTFADAADTFGASDTVKKIAGDAVEATFIALCAMAATVAGVKIETACRTVARWYRGEGATSSVARDALAIVPAAAASLGSGLVAGGVGYQYPPSGPFPYVSVPPQLFSVTDFLLNMFLFIDRGMAAEHAGRKAEAWACYKYAGLCFSNFLMVTGGLQLAAGCGALWGPMPMSFMAGGALTTVGLFAQSFGKAQPPSTVQIEAVPMDTVVTSATV